MKAHLRNSLLLLDDYPVTEVIRVDERTLLVTLPEGAGPGVRNVWVENPGGARGVLQSGLRMGNMTFLPISWH